MFKSFRFLIVLLTAVSLNLGVVDFAEAKRLGSGGSFGSKFSQNNAVKKNSANREQAAPSKAQTTNQTRKQELASKGGLMGILGGLALGGLLGALFFGGAFEGINFFDIALVALAVFLIYKFFFSKRQSKGNMSPAVVGGGRYDDHPSADNQLQYRRNENETFSGTTPPPSASAHNNHISIDDIRGSIPKDFDQAAFISGAKVCFDRLQKAWDDGDLADIRQFTTDHVFAEIQDQHRAKSQGSHTEILSLQAELLKVEQLGSKSEAAVLFEAHMREDGVSTHVSEIWHFTKPNGRQQSTWYIDGIQQVED